MQPTTAQTKDTNITKFYNANRSFQFMTPRLHQMNVSSNSEFHHRNLQNGIYRSGHHKNGYLREK